MDGAHPETGTPKPRRRRLTASSVAAILESLVAGEGHPAIAARFGVSAAAILRIHTGEIWASVPRPAAMPLHRGQHPPSRVATDDQVRAVLRERGEVTCLLVGSVLGARRDWVRGALDRAVRDGVARVAGRATGQRGRPATVWRSVG